MLSPLASASVLLALWFHSSACLKLVLKPAKLDPLDLADFCGGCHHTWADVVLGGAEAVSSLRFQPYRFELSGAGQRRATLVWHCRSEVYYPD
jgi:hypothetical protein